MTHFAFIAVLLAATAWSIVAETEEQKQMNINCRWCHKIVNQFYEGYEATKGNYRGHEGNRKDGRAEMQLAQITEKLCSQESSKRRSKCHSFVEENEDLIEQWWLNKWWPNRFNNKSDTAVRDELFEHFCVQQKSLCCGDGHYGPTCLPCDGYDSDTGKICSGHGSCNGNQTFKGTGKCECYPGYVGEYCDKCDKKYYEIMEPGDDPLDTDRVVRECRACFQGCTEEGCTTSDATACFECAPGWKRRKGGNETGHQPCIDINECRVGKDGSPACPSKDTFCENNLGSFTCIDCNPSCARGQGCSGPNSNQCTACNTPGFVLNEDTKSCEDVDECAAETPACKAEGETCRNSIGSFHCECPFNQEVDHDLQKCVPRKIPLQEIGRFSANSPNVRIGSDDDLRPYDEF